MRSFFTTTIRETLDCVHGSFYQYLNCEPDHSHQKLTRKSEQIYKRKVNQPVTVSASESSGAHRVEKANSTFFISIRSTYEGNNKKIVISNAELLPPLVLVRECNAVIKSLLAMLIDRSIQSKFRKKRPVKILGLSNNDYSCFYK